MRSPWKTRGAPISSGDVRGSGDGEELLPDPAWVRLVTLRGYGLARPRVRWCPGFKPVVKELCRKEGIQLIHNHALWSPANHSAARLAGEMGIPLVSTPHGSPDNDGPSNSIELEKEMGLGALPKKRPGFPGRACDGTGGSGGFAGFGVQRCLGLDPHRRGLASLAGGIQSSQQGNPDRPIFFPDPSQERALEPGGSLGGNPSKRMAHEDRGPGRFWPSAGSRTGGGGKGIGEGIHVRGRDL